MWPVSGGTWTLTASHPSDLFGEDVAGRPGDGAVAQFIPSRVTYAVKVCVRRTRVGLRFLPRPRQHGESGAINHHTFDQNAENLLRFL